MKAVVVYSFYSWSSWLFYMATLFSRLFKGRKIQFKLFDPFWFSILPTGLKLKFKLGPAGGSGPRHVFGTEGTTFLKIQSC